MTNRTQAAIVGVIAVAAAGIAYWYFFHERKPAVIADRLCDHVRSQGMDCLVSLAVDSFVHPGSIINYQPSPNPSSDKLPLPISDITGVSCLVPGENGLKKTAEQKSGVSIPSLSYEVNGGLKVGAAVELPQLDGATIKAGPDWSDVQKVDLTVDEAWLTNLDENLAVTAVRSCSFRELCVERIKAKQYRVVASSLVAKGLSYKFYDSKNAVITLDAGTKGGIFDASIGGGSNIKQTTGATLVSTEPRVVGVTLLPFDVFEGKPTCEDTILFAADGNATVRIGGGGGRGQIPAQPPHRAPIGQVAELLATGTEASECDDDFERKISSAKATASVIPVADGKLKLSYDIATTGGHYVTAAACAAGHVIGKTGHDNAATASADLIGTILVTVRSEGNPILRVDWRRMPSSGGEIRIVDWKNKPLRDAKGDSVVGPIAASGNGVADVRANGPGVYRIETRIQLGASVGGNVNEIKQDSADVTVGIVGDN